MKKINIKFYKVIILCDLLHARSVILYVRFTTTTTTTTTATTNTTTTTTTTTTTALSQSVIHSNNSMTIPSIRTLCFFNRLNSFNVTKGYKRHKI